jgi:Tat protein translocase TatB subunit
VAGRAGGTLPRVGSIGAPEVLVILLVALMVLGPDRLPGAARQAGRAMAEFRRMASGFQAEMRDAMREPVAAEPLADQPETRSERASEPEAGGAPASPDGGVAR